MIRTINRKNHTLIRNVVDLYRIDRTPTCGRPVGDALAALDEEDVDCIVTEYHHGADADEPVSVNDAFTTRFDVDPEELAFDDTAGPAGREADELAGFLRDPGSASVTFETDGSGTVTVHASVDTETATVATLWTGSDDSLPIEATMLDSLLAEVSHAIYAKDEQGRYVRASETLPQLNTDGGLRVVFTGLSGTT